MLISLLKGGREQHDKRMYSTTLRPGDRVLVKNCVQPGGSGKLQPYFEDKIHVVVSQKGELPVYELRPEAGVGRTRILHRNLLFPCDSLVDEKVEVTDNRKETTSNPRQPVLKLRQEAATVNSSDELDDEENMYLHEYNLRHRPTAAIRPDTPIEEQPGEETGDEPDIGPPTEAIDISDGEVATDGGNPAPQNEYAAPQVDDLSDQGHDPAATPDTDPNETTSRPKRDRQPPNTFTYHQLGNPHPHCMPVFGYPFQQPDPAYMYPRANI